MPRQAVWTAQATYSDCLLGKIRCLDPIFADNPRLLEQLNKNEITYAYIPAVENMDERRINTAQEISAEEFDGKIKIKY